MARKRRPSRKSFTGPLAEPIEAPRPSLAWAHDSQELREFLQRESLSILLQRLKKLVLLADHYGIAKTPDALTRFAALAMSLAIDFVPGFRTDLDAKPRRGRAKVHTPQRLASLLAMVEMVKKLGMANTDRDACRFVATADDPDLGGPRCRTALQRRTRSLAKLVSRARKQDRSAKGGDNKT